MRNPLVIDVEESDGRVTFVVPAGRTVDDLRSDAVRIRALGVISPAVASSLRRAFPAARVDAALGV